MRTSESSRNSRSCSGVSPENRGSVSRIAASAWSVVPRCGTAANFARVFGVPGMNHCSGGPATDQFNAFGALVEWVEKNSAPAQIVATAGNGTPWPGRTRPLCAYPQVPKYSGSGSIDEAANFSCQAP